MSSDLSIFQRAVHDNKNPYVMISRAMLHDTSISPKAKGVLAYLLTLPDDWSIRHTQIQKALNIGRVYLNGALEELIAVGYIKRTILQQSDGVGMFTSYRYEVSETKIFAAVSKTDIGENNLNTEIKNIDTVSKINTNVLEINTNLLKTRSGKSTQTCRKSTQTCWKSTPTKEEEYINKEKQLPIKREEGGEFFSCLKDLEISTDHKVWLSANHDEATVRNAVLWATHPMTEIKTTLSSALKWACQTRPAIPKSQSDRQQNNRRYVEQLKLDIPRVSYMEILQNGVEFGFYTGSSVPVVVNYSEQGFESQLDSALRKHGISKK